VMRQQDNDKLLNQLLAKWKTDYKVVVHEDNLKKVRLAERQDLEPVKPKAEKGKTSQPKQEGKTKEGTDKS